VPNAVCDFVPPAFAGDAILEGADAGISIIVCLTEGIPTLDMVTVREYLKGKGAKLIDLFLFDQFDRFDHVTQDESVHIDDDRKEDISIFP
jgi:hypothetical protein